jgi:hypothetical protein
LHLELLGSTERFVEQLIERWLVELIELDFQLLEW